MDYTSLRVRAGFFFSKKDINRYFSNRYGVMLASITN